jgi:hypothetical protein
MQEDVQMKIAMLSRFSLLAALAALLTVTPVDAQGRGNGKDKDKDRARPELIRRGEDRDRDRDRDDRWDYEDWDDDDDWDEDDRRARAAGPPFCRNGQGHPVHGRRWCVEKGYPVGRDGRESDRRDRDGRYDRNGSYDQAHREFHQRHDRQCRMRAAERPLDLQWQIRVRTECKQRHDDWHYRAGRAHG